LRHKHSTEVSILSYTHFTLEERICLQNLLKENYSMRRIAAILGRNVSSISREIKRNRAKYKPKIQPDNTYWYRAWRAQNLYIRRRREQARAALSPGTAAWDFIIDGLKRGWSPEAICGRWHRMHPDMKPLCASTIYRYIRKRILPGIAAKTHLRRRGKHLTSRKSNFNTIQPDRIIPQWPEDIRTRSRIGDWEGDTIYGAIGKGLLVSLVDRKTRYLKLGYISSRNADETAAAIVALLDGLPVRSISLDNGSEFANFHDIEDKLNTLVYFAEPHKPWQRGTNENTNDIVRFYFPKGFDFRAASASDIQFVEDVINSRPRKCLNWLSPAELFPLR